MLVITGSFDVFHGGHKSLIKQVETLRKVLGDEMFFILIMKDHPIKDYLIPPQERLQIVKNWVEKEKIHAKVCLTKCTNEKAADESFYEAVGMPVTDKRIIIVNGVKKDDIDKLHEEMIYFDYNKEPEGKKKIFLVSNEKDEYWQSSSNIKKYLAQNLSDESTYKEAVFNLLHVGAIDQIQSEVLSQYRERIRIKLLQGSLLSDNNIPFPRNRR